MAARWPTQRPATPGTSYPRGRPVQGLAGGGTQKGGEVGLLTPLPPESSSFLFGALPTWARANSTQPVGAQRSLCILFEGHGNWGGDSWLLTSRPVGCQRCIMACASLPSGSRGWGPAHSSCICTLAQFERNSCTITFPTVSWASVLTGHSGHTDPIRPPPRSADMLPEQTWTKLMLGSPGLLPGREVRHQFLACGCELNCDPPQIHMLKS